MFHLLDRYIARLRDDLKMIGVLIVRNRTSVDIFILDKIKPALTRVYMVFEWYLNSHLMILCRLFEYYQQAIVFL